MRHGRERHGAEGVSDVTASLGGMIIDCGQCRVRGDSCADCVVTFLTVPVRPRDDVTGVVVVPAPPRCGREGGATDRVELDAHERRAIDVLASSGLVPPLRLTS